MKRIGLTGGIASGKSTVAKLIRDKGIPVIDADQVAREVMSPGSPVLDEIAKQFGPEFLQEDGSLDREKMGSLVFSDPQSRQKLNQITHPAIGMRAAEIMQSYEDQGEPCIVYEVPLLFEAGLHQIFQPIILVAIPKTVQVQRLISRDHISEQDALARIESQMSLEEKEKLSDYIIDNTKEIEDLTEQIQSIFNEILHPNNSKSSN